MYPKVTLGNYSAKIHSPKLKLSMLIREPPQNVLVNREHTYVSCRVDREI